MLLCVMFFILYTLKAQEQARQYFNYTNRAELAITDSNYTLATKLYDSSLSYLTAPLSQDVYNATLCHILLHQYKEAFKGVGYLIKRGCDSTLFLKVGFCLLKQQTKLFTDFMQSYPDLIAQRGMINPAIAKQIDKFIDSTNTNNDFNCIELLTSYFSLYNHLNEGAIGVNYTDGILSVQPRYAGLLYRHFYENGLSVVLKRSLDMGFIKPEVYANWLEFQGVSYGSRFGVVSANNEIYINPWKGLKKDIDLRRQSLGLCTLDEQAKKTIFWHCFNPYRFEFFANIDNLDNSNQVSKYWVKTEYKHTPFRIFE